MVSHDLRSPLGSVSMASELLKRDAAQDGQKRVELANRIQRTTSVMLHLIEDLLSASKIESGSFSVEPKPEAVESLIAEAIDSFRDSAGAKSIALHAEVDPAALEVACDRHRCLQVFSNLIGNALKFTPPEGTITVSAHSFGDEVRFSVCDSGPGIPEAEREHIFDRYWQASHSRRAGAGLGLFIVKGIVEAHGGRAWAEARAGGACLCFTLPSSLRTQAHPPDVTRH
jgi:signal transduction histidine kinase